MLILLRLLSEKHQFNLVSSEIHNRTRLTKHEQVSVAPRCNVTVTRLNIFSSCCSDSRSF
jgi:bifunctional pyridoxal-dependent enzyme with beta-cystathionase and maltose regulon repressor activities